MAAPPKNRVLVGERVSRAAIDAATGWTSEAIRAATLACDHDRAAILAFARARAGETLDLDDVAAILPGIELWSIACALIAIASGDRGRIIELLEGRRYPLGPDSGELEAIALYAAWRGGAARERLIPETRRLSVRSMTVEGFALVATVGAALDDIHVTAAIKHLASYTKEHAAGIAETDRALARTIHQTIASLPAEVEIPDGGGFTVRAAKQVGRNEPCPCGSGLKFKKCCADKPTKAGSPIAGVSWDEFLTTAADQMTRENVVDLALIDLVRVDFARLEPKPREAAFLRLTGARAWTHAERLVEATATAGHRADLRDQLVHDALEGREPALARRHYELMDDADREKWTLEFTDDDAAAWRELVRRSDSALADDGRVAHVELAYSLLRRLPSLGIIAARACIGAAKFDDADLLLEAVEDTRDRLNLSPGDPAWNVLDLIGEKDDDKDDDEESAEAAELRDSMRQSSARADELEKRLAEMRAALDEARAPAELRRAPTGEEAGRAGVLEGKVEELEALIREGNAERRELRRALQSAAPAAAAVAPAGAKRAVVAEATDSDDAIAEPVATMARPVSIPRFDRRATDAIGGVPASVAAEAMRTIGAIAAGDLAAWRNVKQAKDMPRAVLMARVGIHHRLIMSSEGGSLDVLDLVTREQLMTTLKRLRASL